MSAVGAVSVAEWQPSACVLCACNCGIEVQGADRAITRVKGDKAHQASKGYACEKAQRLAYYQSNPRILSPLRRTAGGDCEEVDWEMRRTDGQGVPTVKRRRDVLLMGLRS